MTRRFACAALLLCALSAARARVVSAEDGDWPALRSVRAAATLAQTAESQPNPAAARRVAQLAFDGSGPEPARSASPMTAGQGLRPNLAAVNDPDLRQDGPPPPPAAAPRPSNKIPPWMVYGGAALIGGAAGWFTGGGWMGSLAGAATGVVSAFFFERGDYGASIGISVGSLIGTLAASFLGGPILGGLIGAVVGGVLGHFLGKAFF